jgi:hypothetical protein
MLDPGRGLRDVGVEGSKYALIGAMLGSAGSLPVAAKAVYPATSTPKLPRRDARGLGFKEKPQPGRRIGRSGSYSLSETAAGSLRDPSRPTDPHSLVRHANVLHRLARTKGRPRVSSTAAPIVALSKRKRAPDAAAWSGWERSTLPVVAQMRGDNGRRRGNRVHQIHKNATCMPATSATPVRKAAMSASNGVTSLKPSQILQAVPRTGRSSPSS